MWGIQRGALRSLGPANTGIGPAPHAIYLFRVSAAQEWAVDIFVFVPWNLCMYVHEAAIHACTRPSPVGLAWGGGWRGVDLQQQEGILGESMGESAGAPRKGALRFHPSLPVLSPSSGLVNCGEGTEEIRAWVWESLGPALFLWQPEPGSFFPPPLSVSSLGGRPGFPVPLLPSGGHQEKDRPKRRGHSKGDREGPRGKKCRKSQDSGGVNSYYFDDQNTPPV